MASLQSAVALYHGHFLDGFYDDWIINQGGLVLISGEARVSKSRLVEEFANRLRWQGIRLLWGRCYEFERVLPYQPVAVALRTILPILPLAELADFPTWVPEELARLPWAWMECWTFRSFGAMTDDESRPAKKD